MNHVITAQAVTHSYSGIWPSTGMDPRLRGDDRPPNFVALGQCPTGLITDYYNP